MIPPGQGNVKMTPYTYITSGTVNLPNTGGAWAELLQSDGVTPFELAIAAAVNDRVAIAYTGVGTTGNPVDIGVMVGTSIKRFLATGSSTPASDGDVGFYHGAPLLPNVSGLRGFTVTANDLDTGNVRFGIVTAGVAASGTFIATANDTFSWQAFNFGPAPS